MGRDRRPALRDVEIPIADELVMRRAGAFAQGIGFDAIECRAADEFFASARRALCVSELMRDPCTGVRRGFVDTM
jgi:hypothetical protein